MNFITSLICLWIEKSNIYKPWMYIIFAVHGEDLLKKLYDLGDSFVPKCVLKENNAFWKDLGLVI